MHPFIPRIRLFGNLRYRRVFFYRKSMKEFYWKKGERVFRISAESTYAELWSALGPTLLSHILHTYSIYRNLDELKGEVRARMGRVDDQLQETLLLHQQLRALLWGPLELWASLEMKKRKKE